METSPLPIPKVEKRFIVSQSVVDELLTKIAELPWKNANPLILLIKNNFFDEKDNKPTSLIR